MSTTTFPCPSCGATTTSLAPCPRCGAVPCASSSSRARRQGPLGFVIAGIVAFVIVGGGTGMWIAGRGIKDRKGELAAAAADPKRLVTPTPNGRALCWVLSEPSSWGVLLSGTCLKVYARIFGVCWRRRRQRVMCKAANSL